MHAFFSDRLTGEVRYHDLPGEQPALFFLHDLGCASSYDYPAVAAEPVLSQYRRILPDLPGHGYSDRPSSFSYSISDYAGVLAEMIGKLAPPAWYLYGHSMGASIAIELASLVPQGLQGVIVSEPNFHPGGGSYSRKIASHEEHEYIACGHDILIEEEQTSWAGSIQSASPRAIWRSARSLAIGADWISAFRQLPQPKQIIYGARSLPNQDASALQAQGITLHTIAGAGHNMALENPAGLAKALAVACTSMGQQKSV